MGSLVELNDTLQITSEQGFPHELDIQTHLKTPYKTEDFQNKVYVFKSKPGIRFFHTPPTRTFLVENKDGKWIYWGLVQILELTFDYEKKTTSGKFRIIYINTPEEMKKAHELIDRRPEKQFFD